MYCAVSLTAKYEVFISII